MLDILWRNYGTAASSGWNDVWYLNGMQYPGRIGVQSGSSDPGWQIAGTGDFNNDGYTDILWRYYGTGAYQGLNDIWYMNGTDFCERRGLGRDPRYLLEDFESLKPELGIDAGSGVQCLIRPPLSHTGEFSFWIRAPRSLL